MAAPVLSHLDPDFVRLLDDVRDRLASVFRAPEGALSLAISGTGTSGMEAAIANLADARTHAIVVVTGYFGDRLAQILERTGARVRRIDVEWGRACDPEAVREAFHAGPADLVAVVHAETSTGVLNPVEAIARIAREHDALVVVDAVTSLGGHPLDIAAWQIDACYSCSQKGLGAPSGLAPLTLGPRALARRVSCRSFYLDVKLIEDFWVRRKYHHTISSTLVYALREALMEAQEEGLTARWERHRQNHLVLAAGLQAMGLTLLPPESERLWTLNAVTVPPGVDEAAVRRHLLSCYSIEIGAGLGPLAGRIWRVGLMGSGSTVRNILLFLGALEDALKAQGYRVEAGAASAAAAAAVSS